MIVLAFIAIILLFIIAVCMITIVLGMDRRPKRDDVSELRVKLAAAQGAVNQLQTCLCLNAGHTPTKVLQTVLGMYGVIVDEDAIPEQIMEAAKGDHVELVILLKMFYGIEIKGVELQ